MIDRANQTWPQDVTYELPQHTAETINELIALVDATMSACEPEDEFERRAR